MKGIIDTLFIPLTARVYVSKRFPEYFYDEQSLKLEEVLPDQSIQKKSSEYSMMASVARYFNIDEMTEQYIVSHPRCQVVYLGCGLETSYFRINRGEALFYEVDMPEVIEVRKQYIGAQERERLIGADLFDVDWAEQMDQSLPTLLIASGVFQYYHEDEILSFIEKVKKTFANGSLIFDATDEKGISYANRYVKKTGNKDAMMYFYVNDCQAFVEKVGVELVEYRPFFTEARTALKKKLNLVTRISMKIADEKERAKLIYLQW